MPIFFEQLNTLLALCTVFMQGAAVALFAVFFLRKKSVAFEIWSARISAVAVPAALALVLAGIAVTLYHSVIVGLLPCPLCYLQRIFLYPQAVLFAVALWKKDRGIADYSLALSVLGAAVALYQHALQMGVVSAAPCIAGGADCAARVFFEFGYITYPLMAFSLFALLIALMLFARERRDGYATTSPSVPRTM